MSDNSYMEKFVHGVEIALAIKELTKSDLQTKAGLHNAFLLRLCDARKASNPRLSSLIKIAEVLGLTIEDIIALPDKAQELLKK